VPPGKNTLFMKALEFMDEFKEITDEETKRLETLARNTKPIFMHG
jgi:hypothetical protein